MSALVFCKFSHNSSLQARGDRITIQGESHYGSHEQAAVYRMSASVIVIEAAYIDEHIVHLLTTDGVFEVRGREGFIIKKIGETL